MLDKGAPYLSVGGRLDDRKGFEAGLKLSNNTVYSEGGDFGTIVQINGGDHKKRLSFGDFQKQGFDTSSRVSGDMPTPDAIVSWARPLLGL